jgi:hypothetical protein
MSKVSWFSQRAKHLRLILLIIHGFRAIFVHLNIAQSTSNASVDDDTAFNLPDSLTYEDIGEHVGNGSDKDAYKLKAYPNLLFLQLNKESQSSSNVQALKTEIDFGVT